MTKALELLNEAADNLIDIQHKLNPVVNPEIKKFLNDLEKNIFNTISIIELLQEGKE